MSVLLCATEFHEYFLELFTWVQSERPTAEQIQQRLAEPGYDQYMVCVQAPLSSCCYAA